MGVVEGIALNVIWAAVVRLYNFLKNKVRFNSITKIFRKRPKPVAEIPLSTEGMVGRDKHIAELKKRLKTCKVLGIIGLAGIGKSTVAAKLAEDLEGEYKICWKDMRRPFEFNTFVSELLFEIGGIAADKTSDYTAEKRIDHLLVILNDKPSLVVLDNLEHRLEQAKISDDYLRRLLIDCVTKKHGSRIILTSRENPEDLYGEYSTYGLRGIKRGSGVALLRKKGLKNEKRDLLVEAERRVDGHPYCLLLLASLVSNSGVELTRCLEDPGLLTEKIGEVFLEAHYKRMSEKERGILEGMSVYREPVPEEAIAVFNGDEVYKHLLSLRNKSLVQSADDLYFLHPIVKDYAYDKLREKPAAHHEGGGWYENRFGMKPPKDTNSPDLVKPQEEMIFHYFQSGTKDDILKGAKITNLIDRFLHRFGLYDKDLQMLQKSRDTLQSAGLEMDTQYAAHLNNMGVTQYCRGEYDNALSNHKASLSIVRAIGDRWGEAAALNGIASIHQARCEYDEALARYSESLAIRRQLRDRAGEAAVLNNIATIYHSQGKYQSALDYYNQGLLITQEIGDPPHEAVTLINIGAVARDQGRFRQAVGYCGRGLKIARRIGDLSTQAAALSNLGETLRARDKYGWAMACNEECLRIRRQIGDRAGEAAVLNNIGLVYQETGKYEKALNKYEEALSIVRELGTPAGEAATLTNIGSLYFAQRNYPRAGKYLLAAFDIVERTGIAGAKETKKWVDALSEKLGRDLLKEDSEE